MQHRMQEGLSTVARLRTRLRYLYTVRGYSSNGPGLVAEVGRLDWTLPMQVCI